MPPQFKTAKCVKNEVLASTYHDIVFETDSPLEFLPGQFITIKVNDKLVRSYSVAGKLPNNQFGLLINISPGGPGSIFFENLKPDDQIEYIGPAGVFTLKLDDGADHLVFLGTGSGIAPLKAMIESALREHQTQKPLTLYFGLRYEKDIHWDEYFKELANQHKNFKYTLCLSKPEENWQGVSGHITDLLKNEFKDTSKVSAYLCGSEKMIEESKKYLTQNKTPTNRIYHEKFY
ncbi:FAD-binding oxidoreductase [Patescibacteria group bacterium]